MKNETAAKQLIAAAKAEDQKAVVDGFKAVASSCKSCHQSYNRLGTVPISRFLMISVTLLTMSSTSFAGSIELRPDDPVYVKMGKRVYLNSVPVVTV